ncbi:MAG: hypothetical protein JXD19_08565, partial [Deltaproteobacteria bacterium]|nr:hypothetical protein [Deltaproteobacteria bacterium]
SEEAPLTLKQRTVTVTALPAEGDGDATTIMIINDITDRKRAEDELQKHHEHLEELVVERTAELKQSNERLQKEIVERKRTEELLKASLRDKEVLLREVNHRTKNNMQIISSLFSLQSARCKDQKVLAIMQDSQNRIRAMALIHETLYQAKQFDSINFGDYVGQLVHDLYAAYRISSDRIHLQIDIQDVSLGIDTAAPCGLVINELVSNSLKHAFPPGTAGTITISATSGADDVIDLIISDDGIGMPSDLDIRKTETVGLQLVFGIVEDQLNGTLEPLRSGGTGFRIRFRGLQGKERM